MVLDRNLQCVKVFIRANDIATVLANCQTGHLTLECILAQVLLRGVFERFLQTVKAHVEELLCILLHSHIDRLTVELFKCKAEVYRVILLTIRHLKEAKHLKPLVERVIVDLDATTVCLIVDSLLVIGSHQRIPEGRHVEELLQN